MPTCTACALKVLPFGTSKGAGLAWLLTHLGVDATRVMAVGDGENDVEMLQLAGVSLSPCPCICQRDVACVISLTSLVLLEVLFCELLS